MENQTTAPVEQSEQPKDVAQQPETTSEVKETVLARLSIGKENTAFWVLRKFPFPKSQFQEIAF